MRELTILELLHARRAPVAMNELVAEMKIAERTLRDALRSLGQDGDKHGFRIRTLRGQGYRLEVEDSEAFEAYRNKERERVGDTVATSAADREARRLCLLRLLLQSGSYQTTDRLADQLGVGRSTVVADLNEAERTLAAFDLTLNRRAHYGIRVEGGERDFRKAFSRFVSQAHAEPGESTTVHGDFHAFERDFDEKRLKRYLLELLRENELSVSDVFLDNIVSHLMILLYRISRQNLIVAGQEMPDPPDPLYLELAGSLAAWIDEQYGIRLPEDETLYLALHLSGKTTSVQMSEEKRERLRSGLACILQRLDEEFLTRFSADEKLLESLVLHMLPLLNRLYYNLQLGNPIVEDVYSEYANVFVVSFRFADMIEELYGFPMSRDEAGYVAMHFAAHLERMKQQNLEQYRRIAVICSTGGGSAQLIKLKLEAVFPKALVVTASSAELDEILERPVDLILTTIPLEPERQQTANKPIVHIRQLLDDAEIQRIKELISTRISRTQPSYKLLDFKELFRRELFHTDGPDDYAKLLDERCREMVKLGYAESDFPRQVLTREGKFTTIYKNGVAGPHPMRMSAIRDCIGVTLLNKPAGGAERPVRLVFLINLRPGQLFLHKEISKLLLVLMEKEESRSRLLAAPDYETFIHEVEQLL